MDSLIFPYMDEFLTLVVLQLIAVASPGPDFAIVVNHSLVHSRRTGLYTAMGIACGIVFHVMLALFGIGLILSQSWWLFNGIKLMAGGYLFALAYKSFKASNKEKGEGDPFCKPSTPISLQKAFYTGVLTNLLNPKVVLFFLSVFTVVVSPKTPTPLLIGYGISIFLITLTWFFFIALCFSSSKVHVWFARKEQWIHRITALIFASLALKLLYDLFKGL